MVEHTVDTAGVSQTEMVCRLRDELIFERRAVAALQAELRAIKAASDHTAEQEKNRLEAVDDAYSASLRKLKEAVAANQFETLRTVFRKDENPVGRKHLFIPWDKVDVESVVHVSCSEAVAATADSAARDYVGMPGDAKIQIHAVVCGHGVVVVDLEYNWQTALHVMVNVTLFTEPSQFVFGRFEGVKSLERVKKAIADRQDYLCNLAAIEEGSDTDFVKAIFLRFLNRSVDKEGLDTHVEILKRHGASRRGLVLDILNSEEYRISNPPMHV